MPTQFDLPTLDQKDYAKLFAQLRQSIPKYSSNWTDYNDSDPGITILQLLSWLGDATLYRIDRVPRELYLNFARLILGAAYSEVEELIDELEEHVLVDFRGTPVIFADDPIPFDPARLALAKFVQRAEQDASITSQMMRTACLSYLKSPYRAITPDDFEQILVQMTADVAFSTDPGTQKVMRVVCQVVEQLLRVIIVGASYPPTTQTVVKATVSDGKVTAPANISVTLQGEDAAFIDSQNTEVVEAAVELLTPRVPLGTPVQVMSVGTLPVAITGRLAVLPSAVATTVLSNVAAAIQAWMDPLTGGPEGTGWPVGRKFLTHDLVKPLSQVAGIDHSQPLQISVTDFQSTVLGESQLGYTFPTSVDPTSAVPIIGYLYLDAVSSTWPIQVGVHARVGVDTTLPLSGVGA